MTQPLADTVSEAHYAYMLQIRYVKNGATVEEEMRYDTCTSIEALNSKLDKLLEYMARVNGWAGLQVLGHRLIESEP